MPDDILRGRVLPLVGSPLGLTAGATGGAIAAGSPTYGAVIAADTPLAWWRLAETAGTTAVDSGSGTPANGTYTGTYTLGLAGVDGANGGKSVLFTNGYVDVGALPAKLQLATGTDFSLEAWVYFEVGTTPGPAIMTEAFAGDGTVRYTLGFGNGGGGGALPSFGWYNGTWRQAIGSVALNDGRWHHVVGTYDAAANLQRLYVDTAQVATNTPGGTQPGGVETFYLGRRWDSSASINGVMDELAIYGYRLSSAQIGAHYLAKAESATLEARDTQALAEVILTDTTPEARTTQALAEVILTDTTPEARLTQIVVEAVVERDYIFIDVTTTDGDPLPND
jgi:hypothetical protein